MLLGIYGLFSHAADGLVGPLIDSRAFDWSSEKKDSEVLATLSGSVIPRARPVGSSSLALH
jgi:hypothetical protein